MLLYKTIVLGANLPGEIDLDRSVDRHYAIVLRNQDTGR